MDRHYKTPQELLAVLRTGWFKTIEHGASVTMQGSVMGRNIELIATWGNGQQYRKAYFDPQKKPCHYARDFLRSLLDARGVI
jgi:hypothetical protein